LKVSGIWLKLGGDLNGQDSPMPYEFVIVDILRDEEDKNRFVSLYIKDTTTGNIRHYRTTSKNRVIVKRRAGEVPMLQAVSAYNYVVDYSNILDLGGIL
jgi:hypothetical protein